MTKVTEQESSASFNRVSMEPVYERLLKKSFPDSAHAIEYCRTVCAEFGFTVKQEASANRNIYVYCSREGLPDSQRNPRPSPQRKRPSKRCDCRWRVVLSENDQEQWVFRKSLNPNASEHNHEMMSPDEMVKAWPQEVNDMIIQLARQRLQTHEIREAVKQRFPDITWNERRFYNRLTEERKRIRQKAVIERTQRLVLLSARLCSVVAGNEDWATCVESDLSRMLDNFCQLTRMTPELLESLVDIHQDLIQSDAERLASTTHRLSLSGAGDMSDETEEMTSPSKKRKSVAIKADVPKGAQPVYIPNYTLYVRSQPPRSSSESSSQSSRQTLADSPTGSHSPQAAAVAMTGPSAAFFSLASPTSTSSSSSMPFRPLTQPKTVPSPQQQVDGGCPSSSSSSFMISQPYNTPSYAAAAAAATAVPGLSTYPVQNSFSPYTTFSSPQEMPFTMDHMMLHHHHHPAPQQQQQQQQHHQHPQLGGHHHQQHQRIEKPEPTHPTDPQRGVFGCYPVKEEPLQQRAMFGQAPYDNRMQRSLSHGYSLPLIRSNEEESAQQQQQQQQQQQHMSLSMNDTLSDPSTSHHPWV